MCIAIESMGNPVILLLAILRITRFVRPKKHKSPPDFRKALVRIRYRIIASVDFPNMLLKGIKVLLRCFRFPNFLDVVTTDSTILKYDAHSIHPNCDLEFHPLGILPSALLAGT